MSHRLRAAVAVALTLVSFRAFAAFGVTTSSTKIGDVGEVYTAGYHGLVVDGGTLYAVHTRQLREYVSDACGGASSDVAVLVTVSNNGGVTWGSSHLVAHGCNIDFDGAGIAIGPDPASGVRRLHVVWGDRGTVADPSMKISYASATLPGLAFGAPVTISAPADSGSATPATWSAAVAADGIGGVHVTYIGAGGTTYSRSPDAGATWPETGTLVVPNGNQVALSADAAGNVLIAYSELGSVYVTKRAANGTWGNPIAVNGAAPPGGYVSVVSGARGTFVAWFAASGSMGVYVASSSDGTTWSEMLVIPGSTLFDPSIAVDANGVPGVACTAGLTSISYARAQLDRKGNMSWGAPVTVLTGSSIYFANLAFDAAGKALIMYETDAIRFTREP